MSALKGGTYVRLESLTYFCVRLESLTYFCVRLESLTYLLTHAFHLGLGFATPTAIPGQRYMLGHANLRLFDGKIETQPILEAARQANDDADDANVLAFQVLRKFIGKSPLSHRRCPDKAEEQRCERSKAAPLERQSRCHQSKCRIRNETLPLGQGWLALQKGYAESEGDN